MKGKVFETLYSTIVEKGTKGECVDFIHTYVPAVKLKLRNNKEEWFLLRDVKEID